MRSDDEETEAGDQIRFPVTLPGALHEWVRKRAYDDRRSMADVVREAVTEYKARTDEPPGSEAS